MIIWDNFHLDYTHFIAIKQWDEICVTTTVDNPASKHRMKANTVNPLYNDIHYNSKIRYNVNLVCTKISGSYMFFIDLPFYSSQKHTFCVFVRIASARRF